MLANGPVWVRKKLAQWENNNLVFVKALECMWQSITVKWVHLLLLLKCLKAISCFDKVITIFEGIFLGPQELMGARVSSLGDCLV
jgi:hypothetical protein